MKLVAPKLILPLLAGVAGFQTGNVGFLPVAAEEPLICQDGCDGVGQVLGTGNLCFGVTWWYDTLVHGECDCDGSTCYVVSQCNCVIKVSIPNGTSVCWRHDAGTWTCVPTANGGHVTLTVSTSGCNTEQKVTWNLYADTKCEDLTCGTTTPSCYGWMKAKCWLCPNTCPL